MVMAKEDVLSKQIYQVVQAFHESTIMREYLAARAKMRADQAAQNLINEFQQAKFLFAAIEEFGKWAPDYEEKRQLLSDVQTKMNHHSSIQEFKRSEKSIEQLLDDLTERIFSPVLEGIPIEFQTRFRFARRQTSCSCQSGKSGCKCKD